jgi:hypothetical protein
MASDELTKVLYEAVRYALDRVQTDPEFRWHMLATETFRRLVKAEAKHLGKPEDEVRRLREVDAQPDYRKRRAECAINRDYVRRLQGCLEEHGIYDYPGAEG